MAANLVLKAENVVEINQCNWAEALFSHQGLSRILFNPEKQNHRNGYIKFEYVRLQLTCAIPNIILKAY